MSDTLELSPQHERRHREAHEYEQVAVSMIYAAYRDLDVSATGRLFAQTVLDEIRKRVKVRTDDVRAAIEYLVDSGTLTAERDDEDWLLALTPSGHQLIHSPHLPGFDRDNPWGSLVEKYRLVQAKRRASARTR